MRTPGRMRLLMTADAVGGVWSYALDLADGLSKHGVETVLAVFGPAPTGQQMAEAARVTGLELMPLELPLEWLAGSAAEVEAAAEVLRRLSREVGAELVHLNAPGPAAAGAFDTPMLIVCHSCVATWWQTVRGGQMPADFRWRADVVARAYRAADLLIAPSASFAAATRAAYDLATLPCVVHNGRRPATTHIAAPRTCLAFTAGRLWDEGKDARTLDRAAERLPFPFLAAGPSEGPNGIKLELSHLRLLGRLSSTEVAEWLSARPIFASASIYEPFGLAVLEAAKAGCPLVLADTAGFRELWDGAAVFVPPGDAAGFAAAIGQLADDRERRGALGVAAQERARRYSVDAQLEAMLELYRRLLRSGSGKTGRNVAA